jgi:hypothetical protein
MATPWFMMLTAFLVVSLQFFPLLAHHHYLREESHHRATQEEMCNGLLTTGDFLTLFNDTITVLQNDDSLVNVISLDGNIVEQERRAFRMPKQQSYRV